MHQYTRIPLGRAFALSLLITLCGLVVIEIPEMLLLPQIYADRSYYPSALQFVLDPIYFGGFILVIPLAAALPYTNSFVMRLKTGNWYYAMIRCGKKRYLQKECLSAFIRGGGGVALGFVTTQSYATCSFCHPIRRNIPLISFHSMIPSTSKCINQLAAYPCTCI